MFIYILEFKDFGIPIFGVCVALALFGSIEIFKSLLRNVVQAKDAENISILSVIVGIIGSKIWYEIFYSESPFSNFNVFEGISGLVFHGGFITGSLTFLFLIYIKKYPVTHLLDAAALAVLFAYGVGRLGCQLSGDGDYGVATDSFLGMIYPSGTVPTYTPVYPTPVFESLLSFLGFGMIFRYANENLGSGKICSKVFVWMGLSRFLIEFIRPNPVFALGLTDAQIFSLILSLIGLFGYVRCTF